MFSWLLKDTAVQCLEFEVCQNLNCTPDKKSDDCHEEADQETDTPTSHVGTMNLLCKETVFYYIR